MESTNLGAKWQGRPLCCRYLLVSFASQPILVRVGAAAPGWSVTWALGTLSDGQREVLGAWQHSIGDVMNWQAVFDDLAVRGVERIRFVVTADADAARAALPHSAMLNSVVLESAHIGTSPEALSPPLRRLADSAEAATQQMQAALARMIHRHGSFDSPQAAGLFLDAAFQRLEDRSRAHALGGQYPQGPRALWRSVAPLHNGLPNPPGT